jgi:predicted RNA-binding Zn-ribbon protein involved in translation (DUF1610 family)
MCEIDLDPCEVWSEIERTARKEHACTTCGSRIEPGSRYVDHFHVHDGDGSVQKMCLPCRADRDSFAEAHGEMTPTPSYFPQLLLDCIADGEPESERKWKPMYAALLSRREAARPKEKKDG